MEKVRPWCGQSSDRGRLRNRTDRLNSLQYFQLECKYVCNISHSIAEKDVTALKADDLRNRLSEVTNGDDDNHAVYGTTTCEVKITSAITRLVFPHQTLNGVTLWGISAIHASRTFRGTANQHTSGTASDIARVDTFSARNTGPRTQRYIGLQTESLLWSRTSTIHIRHMQCDIGGKHMPLFRVVSFLLIYCSVVLFASIDY